MTLLVLILAFEAGLYAFMPDRYRGYLVETGNGNVKWALGPFEPSQPAIGFNPPIPLHKPEDTLRIVSLGTSGTEGWLTAKTVFQKYGQRWESKSLSSYSRALEYSLNTMAEPTAKRVEVINLGLAAYNITDVTRMLKDSMKLDPDLLLIQIGGNETWTAERQNWSTYIDDDLPYLYSELFYEILTETRAGWRTLTTGGNAFNPMALFSAGSRPIVPEPPDRAAGLDHRLSIYQAELQRLGKFVSSKGLPTLFLIPSQNIADFEPFGSMATPGTDPQHLQQLNDLLIEALSAPAPQAKDRFLELLARDDGIAEAHFQLGKIYLREADTARARAHFWAANDRDLVLKRLPSAFHEISREFVGQYGFPYIDEMEFFAAGSASGIVGYNRLDDDVHPNRQAQFDLGAKIATTIIDADLLPNEIYAGNLQQLPSFDDYNESTGFDQETAGTIAFLKAAHNYLAFGRYRQRLQWHPQPADFIAPILQELETANAYAPNDFSLYLSAVLYLYIDQNEQAEAAVAALNCSASAERAAQVHGAIYGATQQVLGNPGDQFRGKLSRILTAQGCKK